MGRDIRRHTNGDTARAINKQVRKLGWKYCRFDFGIVVVFLKVYRVLVDIIDQFMGDLF